MATNSISEIIRHAENKKMKDFFQFFLSNYYKFNFKINCKLVFSSHNGKWMSTLKFLMRIEYLQYLEKYSWEKQGYRVLFSYLINTHLFFVKERFGNSWVANRFKDITILNWGCKLSWWYLTLKQNGGHFLKTLLNVWRLLRLNTHLRFENLKI